MIVPNKRAAMLLDRLMVALHHALEDERNGNRRIGDVYGRGRFINTDREINRHMQDISMEDLAKAWENGKVSINISYKHNSNWKFRFQVIIIII